MVELLSPTNAYAGVNLVSLLVLVLLSAVFFICFTGFVKYSIVLNIIKKRGGYTANPACDSCQPIGGSDGIKCCMATDPTRY